MRWSANPVWQVGDGLSLMKLLPYPAQAMSGSAASKARTCQLSERASRQISGNPSRSFQER